MKLSRFGHFEHIRPGACTTMAPRVVRNSRGMRFWRCGRDVPPATPGPGPRRDNRAVAGCTARAAPLRMANRGAGAHHRHCPSHCAGLRLLAPSQSSFPAGDSCMNRWTCSQTGGRARAGARCHREGTLALSRTCSVCRYCAHAAVEWRRSAALVRSRRYPQRHWARPLGRQTPAHVRCCCSTTMRIHRRELAHYGAIENHSTAAGAQ